MDDTSQIVVDNVPASLSVYDKIAEENWPTLETTMSRITTGQDTDIGTIRLVVQALSAYLNALVMAGVRVDFARPSELLALLKPEPDLTHSFRDAYHRRSFNEFLRS